MDRGDQDKICEKSMRLKQYLILLTLCVAIAGCTTTNLESPDSGANVKIVQAAKDLVPFSGNSAGSLPNGYVPMVVFRTRKPTDYQIVQDQNRAVLHARAEGATSGLRQQVNIDPTAEPWINWQWKIGAQVNTVSKASVETEDSPVRIVLGFDGDKDTLTFGEQIMFETAKLITGHDFPFATLMYVWDSKLPTGTVQHSKRSNRIRSIVVDHGPEGVGQWRDFSRNIIDDYKKAYGEMPGKLIAIGVLTDTDIEDETVEAWYGDIHFKPHNQSAKMGVR